MMRHYFKVQLQTLLGMTLSDEAEETACSAEYKNYGPGYVNPWQLLRGRKNCHLHIEANSSTQYKEKVIIADNTFEDEYLTDGEIIDFISGLTKFFEVHLWYGESVLFSESKPLADVNEFYVNRQFIKPASQETVRASLARQGIALDRNDVIIDRAVAARIIKRIKAYSAEDFLTESDALYYHDINLPLRVKLPQVGPDFGTMTRYEFENVSGVQTLDFSDCSYLKSLRLKACNTVTELVFPTDNHLERVYLAGLSAMNKPSKKRSVDLSSAEHLVELIVGGIVPFSFPKNKQLQRFYSACTVSHETDFSAYSQLLDLTLHGLAEEFNPRDHLPKSLQSVDLSWVHHCPIADFSDFTQLRTIKIKSSEVCQFKFPPQLERLLLQDIRQLDFLDLTEQRKLRYLALNRLFGQQDPFYLMSEVRLPSFAPLLVLDVSYGFWRPKHLITACQTLVKLRIRHDDSVLVSRPNGHFANIIDASENGITYNLGIRSIGSILHDDYSLSAWLSLTSFRALRVFDYMASVFLTIPDLTVPLPGSGSHSAAVSIYLKMIDLAPSLKAISFSSSSHVRHVIDYEAKSSSVAVTLKGSFTFKSPDRTLVQNPEPYFPQNLTASVNELKAPSSSAIDRRNQANNLVLYDAITTDSMDGNVRLDTQFNFSGSNLKCELISAHQQSKNDYRTEVFDGVQFSQGKIRAYANMDAAVRVDVMVGAISKDQIELLKGQTKNNSDSVLALVEGRLEADQWYAIPALRYIDPSVIQLYCDVKDVEFYWHPVHQLNYIKSKVKVESLNLACLSKQELSYENDPKQVLRSFSSEDKLVVENPAHLLPQDLIGQLQERIKSHPPLAFIVDEKQTPEDKILRLLDYVNELETQAQEEKSADHMDVLWDLIKTPNGACRHRSRVFFYLARLIGVPVSMEANPQHQYNSLPYRSADDPEKIKWVRVRVKGAPALDLTPEEKYKPVLISDSDTPSISPIKPKSKRFLFDLFLGGMISSSAALIAALVVGSLIVAAGILAIGLFSTGLISFYRHKKNKQPKKQIKNKITEMLAAKRPSISIDKPSLTAPKNSHEYYRNEFALLGQKNQVTDLAQLFEESADLVPLVMLSPGQTPFQADSCFLNYLKKKNIPHLEEHYIYIDSPDDFEDYLRPYSAQNGARMQIDGPLKTVIAQGGYLVVNWSNFNSEQQAHFKSILDAEPKLFEQLIAKKLRMIGLTTKSIDSFCHSFLSRSKRWTINNDLLVRHKMNEVGNLPSNALVCDLLERPAWHEPLLGAIETTHQGMTIKNSPLMSAIQAKRPFIIYNPPLNDIEFDALVHRINVHRQFLYNGKPVMVPKECHIILKTKPIVLQSENVIVHANVSDEKKFTGRKYIYLGLYNLHECYDRRPPDPDYFKQYQSNHIFYLSGHIPKGEWAALIAKAQEKYPDKKFEFMLAPGAVIEKIAKSEAHTRSERIEPEQMLVGGHQVITTNDVDYVVQQLASRHPVLEGDKGLLVAAIHPDTLFKDLMDEVRVNSKVDHLHSILSYHSHGVLMALRKGRKVILRGLPSALLYQQLLPYLEAYPDQLVLIMPQAAQKYALVSHTCCEMTFDHYKKILLNEDKESAAQLDQVQEFYHYAQLLSHRGAGQPEAPPMSYHLIKSMLAALRDQNPLHPHNPIKGLFHYNYLKHSADYAYLNVMAKVIFKADDVTPYRKNKLIQLIKKYKINDKEKVKRYVWFILNCFNGAELRQLLSDDLKNAILSGAIPAVNPTIIENLFNKIAGLDVNNSIVEHPRSHPDKQMLRLKRLIEAQKRFILKKGPPGVGKTYAVRHTIQSDDHYHYFESETAIIDCLRHCAKTPADNKKVVLLLDEGNLAKPGTWDFLLIYDLSSNQQSKIFYQDEEFAVQTPFTVVLTGNPENYPQRYFHELLQRHAEIIYLDKPDNEFLKHTIIRPILDSANLYTDEVADAICYSADLMSQYDPYLCISIRDIENIAQRFLLLAGSERNPLFDGRAECVTACVAEFAGVIEDRARRQEYIQKLNQHLGITLEEKVLNDAGIISITPDFFTTQQKEYLVNAVQQNLQFRDKVIADAKHAPASYKRLTLIKGGSGVGKSTLLKKMIENHLKHLMIDTTQKKLYEITSGTQNIYNILLKAFHEGAIVILEELNLDDKSEILLNQLLSGADVQGKPAQLPGFMVFSSYNPPDKKNIKGRKTLSPALMNRSHLLHMDEYNEAELKVLAKKMNVENVEAFVKAYQEARALYPHSVNMRTFFIIAKKVALTQSTYAHLIPLFRDEANNHHNLDESLAPKMQAEENRAQSRSTIINRKNLANLSKVSLDSPRVRGVSPKRS